jgi:hypothetical protein
MTVAFTVTLTNALGVQDTPVISCVRPLIFGAPTATILRMES